MVGYYTILYGTKNSPATTTNQWKDRIHQSCFIARKVNCGTQLWSTGLGVSIIVHEKAFFLIELVYQHAIATTLYTAQEDDLES
jgi:hypothetical protein